MRPGPESDASVVGVSTTKPRGGFCTMSQEETNHTVSRRKLLQQAVAGAAGITAASIGLEAASAAPLQTSSLLRKSLQDDKVEILHWSHPLTDDDTKVFDPLIQRFQEAGNNIDVKVELI